MWSIRFNTIGHLANSPTTIDVKIRLIKKNDKQSSSLPISHVIKDWMKMKKKVNWSIFFFQVKCYGNFFIIFFLSWTIVIENDFFFCICVCVCVLSILPHCIVSVFFFFNRNGFPFASQFYSLSFKKKKCDYKKLNIADYFSITSIHSYNQSIIRSIDRSIHPSIVCFCVLNHQLSIVYIDSCVCVWLL